MKEQSNTTMLEQIKTKIEARESITQNEAVWLFEQADSKLLQELSTQVRNRLHPSTEATYLIMAIVNYTNICVAKCDFCSFYRLPHQEGTYLLSFEAICEKIDALVELGGTMVAFNGGFHPKLTLQDYAELFRKIHSKYPQLSFFEMTVAEFMFACKKSKLSYDEGASILKEAGTQWITGGGAEVLSESFRQRHSPGKYHVDDYYRAQASILRSGLRSTATMVIGFDESLAERMDHLNQLRQFQNEQSNKLASFLCWVYKPENNELGGKEIALEEYLRWLAVCRIFLDNFTHIRTSVLTKNEDALRGLNYGANDFDLPIEDEVTQKAGSKISLDFPAILAHAQKAGFTTQLRPPL